ncbi:MAG: CSLREA domain-containing protein [Chloroflexi bacterium]|nr:CSLREA domain-containing protein [Chloroflexota bacterium]
MLIRQLARLSPRFVLLLIAGLCAAFAIAALALPPGLNAAPTAGEYTVDSTADLPDDDPSDGLCHSSNSHCTLRAAIMEVNFASIPHTITVPAGTYVLTRVGFDDTALVGDLDILQSVTIHGAGPGATIIDGNSALTGDRVFQIKVTAPNVTLNGMTIRNGRGPTGTLPTLLGGGIFREGDFAHGSNPLLRLSNVLLENNSAEDGGGLYNTGGLLELANTTVHANAVTNRGGGVFVGDANTIIRDSTVYSNSGYQGGGLAFSNAGTSQILRTELYSNTVQGYGGALSHSNTAADQNSTIVVQYSSIHNNHAGFNGGAIDDYASLSISRTVVNANTAGQYGGAIMVYQTYYPSKMIIVESTLSGNQSTWGGAVYYNDFAGATSVMRLINSTVSFNAAVHDGGGLYGIGSAHYALYNATIADNHSTRIGLGTARGGGVFLTTTATLTTANSLIANNGRTTGALSDPDDCYGTLYSYGYNLIRTTTNCTLGGLTTGEVLGLDPLLGPLPNNGGAATLSGQPAPARALLIGSPAIDMGNPAGCAGFNGSLLAHDQRGFMRSINGRCDIGAFEYSPYVLALPLIRR